MIASNEIAGNPPADRAAGPAATGRTFSSHGVSSTPNSTDGASVPSVSFGKMTQYSKRMFTPDEDAVFHQIRAGQLSVNEAVRTLGTSDVALARHYLAMFGEPINGGVKRLRRPVYQWSEADRPMLLKYSRGEITMTDLRKVIGASAPTVRKAMRDMGISLPGAAQTARDYSAEPLASGVWIPIAHKRAPRQVNGRDVERTTWVQIDGAPLTIDEANALSDAGNAVLMQRKENGGYTLEIRVLAKKGRKR